MSDKKKNINSTENEINELNSLLMSLENAELPESLSTERMKEQFQTNPQTKDSKIVSISSPRRKRKKRFLGAVAAVVAVTVGVCAVGITAPFSKIPPKVNESVIGKTPVHADDYTEIEAKFQEYSENYKKYHNSIWREIDGFFYKVDSMTTDEMAGDTAAPESANGSASTNAFANKENSHGETNEQVEGVNEGDIIKNDGKYLYVANPALADWDTFYDELSRIIFTAESADTTLAFDDGAQTTPAYDPKGSETAETEKTLETTESAEPDGTLTTVAAEENPASKETETQKQEIVKADPKTFKLPEIEYDCSISIIEPDKNGKMNTVSRFEIKNEQESIIFMSINEMYVSGDTLTAVVTCQKVEIDENDEVPYDNAQGLYYGSEKYNVTMTVSYDISDRANPVEKWRQYQDGSFISSRVTGGRIIVLSSYYVNLNDETDIVKTNCVPEISCDCANATSGFCRIATKDICIMNDINSSSYLVATSTNIQDSSDSKSQAILGAGENVYCTTETLYATSTDYSADSGADVIFGYSGAQKTQIYKFDISDGDIKYLKNASIDGYALNQFSIDEYNGYLRIATTSGNWGENLVNQVYILNENLETAGLLKDIAKGENIRSVRFTGNTGYVVTFMQTDPLFVIDLSDPAAPKILGELKIPGYSAYLHPVGDGLMLGVGPDGTENGTNGSLKVSLFDVSDPQNPVECSKYVINARKDDGNYAYVYSEGYYSHKALCWDKENSVMYVPYGTYEHVTFIDSTTAIENFTTYYTAGVLAVKVDEKTKSLVNMGQFTTVSADHTQINTATEFNRTTYINNVLFGLDSGHGVLCSFDKNTGAKLDSIVIAEQSLV